MSVAESFKVPQPAPPGFTLRRVSWLQRTVRYEWPCSHCGIDHHCPPFVATSLEWDRARD